MTAGRAPARSLLRRLAPDGRGVVLAEFAIAIVPILLLFFCICQLSVLAYVHLMVKHAAFVGVRTEAVVHPRMPDAGSEDDVKAGVMMLLGAIPGVDANDVTIQTSLAGRYEQKLDTVTVVLQYRCSVPLADHIICTSGTFPLKASASFPNQGSSYQRIWGS